MNPAKRMRSKSIHTSAPLIHREGSDESSDENEAEEGASVGFSGKDEDGKPPWNYAQRIAFVYI